MQKLTPEFAFMKGIPIAVRVKRILIVAAIGFALQLFVSPLFGWLIVLAAALMGLMESRSNKPEVTDEGDWQTVTIEEVEKARELLKSTSKVKAEGSIAEGGCLTIFGLVFGGLVLFLAVDGGNVRSFFLPVMSGGPLSVPLVIDGLTFAAVFLLGGRAGTWEPPDLRVKFEQMGEILELARTNPQLELQPSLQLSKVDEGAVPMDCKLLVKLKDGDPNFIGIQVQVSFNEVKNERLPYTYCVLLAKPEFGLTKRTETIEMPPRGGFSVGFLGLFAEDNEKREAKFARFHGSLIELKREGEVDIAVVRQDTSHGEGYTTSTSEAAEVFSDAYLLAKQMMRTA